MYLVLYHGPGVSGMSSELNKIKKEFDPSSITELYSKTDSLESLKLEALSQSLFSEQRLLILSDFLDLDVEKLPDLDNLTIILKFSKTLRENSLLIKQTLKRGGKVAFFPEGKETSIFPFLDLLAERNPKAYTHLDKLFKEFGSQYILVMIIFMLRRFVVSPKQMPDFALRRFNIQKNNMSLQRVKDLYRRVLETDFKIKSGLVDEKLGLTLLAEMLLH